MKEEPEKPAPRGWLAFLRKADSFRALRNRDYRLLWIGQVGHSAALWSEAVARSWLIWEMTGSGTMLALVNLLRAIPMIAFGLLAGVVADRFDKRKVLIICQTTTLVNKVILALLIITGTVEVWHVLVTAFIMGTSMSFNQPTRMSLVPSLVKKDELTNAIALNSAAMNITRILGPMGAGLLLAPVGIGGVYLVSSAVYVVTIISTIMLRVPPVIARAVKTTMKADMVEAFRYVYREKTIFSLMLLALIPMTFALPYMTLMPIFADKVLGIGGAGLGWLYAATGTGALISVFTIATLGKVPHKGWVVLFAVFAFGGLLAAFSQSTSLPLSLVILGGVGFVSTGFMVLINTSLLEIAPPELHGRVMGVYRLDRGLMPLGTMTVGPMADIIGAPSILFIMGGICMVLALFMGIGIPRVRRIT